MEKKDKSSEVITDHTFGTWRAQRDWKTPLYISKAEGAYFNDIEGKRYLDFSSQLMCSNLGHGNSTLITAITDQVKTLPYVAPGFVCEAKQKIVECLNSIMPEELNQYFFSTSGTEANEMAIKLVRQYMQPRYKIISRYHSYHGATAASIALTGDLRRWSAEPVSKIPGVIHAPDAYCYRCPFGLEYPKCNIQCAEYVDYMIKEEGNIAAVVIEPVVGTNGIIIPPPEYLPMLRSITERHSVLLVADEVMSGWYRTGTLFAFEHWNILPDIITTAKGCTGAYTPLGITITTNKIKDFFEDRFFSHGHTYAMHPVALSAVPAAVEEYRRLDKSGVLKRGSLYLEKKLRELSGRHRCIGDVRGKGHFWAIELVKNRKNKTPFNTKADKAILKPLLVSRLTKEMLSRGLFLNGWISHLIIAPPLIINEKEIDRAVDILDEVLKIADRETEK